MVFGPKRDEVIREWRRLHSNDLYPLYSPSYVIRVIKSTRLRWARHTTRMGMRKGAYRVYKGKPEAQRQLVGPRLRWEDNIKMNLRELGWGT